VFECGGDGIDDGECDCDGNIDVGCGCGDPEFECSDGSFVCDESECPPDDVFGCMDESACNYSEDATADDGSCEYAEENFDCDGNCVVDTDCNDECGGDAVEDDCGVCEGDNDCYGCTGPDSCNYDPDATIDDGSCFYAEENYDCDGNCVVDTDCVGQCGGDAVVDECGECGGDGSSCGSHFELAIDQTGESHLVILQDTIAGLDEGDEIGIFDAEGVLNTVEAGESAEYGELLVGTGVWIGEQLNISAIMSLDLSDFSGPVLAGAVDGNPVIIKVYDVSEAIEVDVAPTITSGGEFGDLFTVVSDLGLGGGTDDGGADVPGCTDIDACNYDLEATDDDGSCFYAEENFDCDGNCVVDIDCAGQCGGTAELDDCGVCDGGNADIDECGECFGNGIDEGACDCDGNVEDCAGECGRGCSR
jgi:hypothetical protein